MKAIILATGPSLSSKQLDIVESLQAQGKAVVFGMNHIYKIYNDLDYFLACNVEYYDYEWNRGLESCSASKWTWNKLVAEKYKIHHVWGEWGEGFSVKPNTIHFGHSSGFQLPGLAYRLGYRELLLMGYDMKFADDYDGRAQKIGSTPRHFFGEYPKELQHWPSVKIGPNGEFTELIAQFEKVKEINADVEIINCTPGSAMECFPMANIEDFL